MARGKIQDKNNSVRFRNFNEACDFHDVVKTLLMRMIRRNHPDHNTVKIISEHNTDAPNESYPDIQVVIKRYKKPIEIIVYEIQEKVTESWKKSILKRYEHLSNCEIIELDKLRRFIATDNSPLTKMEKLELKYTPEFIIRLKKGLRSYVI